MSVREVIGSNILEDGRRRTVTGNSERNVMALIFFFFDFNEQYSSSIMEQHLTRLTCAHQLFIYYCLKNSRGKMNWPAHRLEFDTTRLFPMPLS